jgi:serine/threonine protein kinase
VSWIPDGVVKRLREVAGWPELPTDRYAVRRPIGRGGMGTVFEALDTWLHRDVAIKISNAPAPGSDLEGRLRQEARVLARLEHPGIVPVHDLGLLGDGRLFYVMKLVRGETLQQHAASLATEHERLTVFERIAETVAFAHAAGVVHRDLKPSNVMVGNFGEVLVLDWGVAKLVAEGIPPSADRGSEDPLQSDRSARSPEWSPRSAEWSPRSSDRGSEDPRLHRAAVPATDAGTRLGTPGFMSPEQARGDLDAVGPRSDVYALGALLFWLWAGEPPPLQTDVRARLRACRPLPSKRLIAIVARCLEDGPASRYPDSAALAADIGRLRAGLAVTALPETMFDRLWRFIARYRTFILLIAAYLVMRTLIALLARA